MKICPKCHSSYSDETLNFCLTDGVPLVAAMASGERLSSQHSWQEAETLHDSNFIFPSAGEHTTSPNSGSPTFVSSGSHTTAVNVLPPQKSSSNRFLLPVVGVLLAAGLAGGAFWYFGAQGMNPSINSRGSIPSATVEVKKTSVAL